MILYQYRCDSCQQIFEQMNNIDDRHHCLCPHCGSESTLMIVNYNNRDWFREGYWEHFDLHPIYVKSKGHLKELCKQYGVYCKAMDPIEDKRGC